MKLITGRRVHLRRFLNFFIYAYLPILVFCMIYTKEPKKTKVLPTNTDNICIGE